jgi:hypothetical protein
MMGGLGCGDNFMNYIIDTMPKFCPGCGRDLASTFDDQYKRSDWFSGASHSCNCGACYQYVETEKIMEAAEDLAHYHNR